MIGMIEKYAKESVKINMKSGVSDGKLTYTSYDALALALDMARGDKTPFGTVVSSKVFYIAPFDVTPVLPLQIEQSGTLYNVQELQTYVNLKGVLQGYRMTVTKG